MQTLPADRQEKLAPPENATRSASRALAAAFASFNQTAGTLESSYTKLHAEVGRLRHELENKNLRLAQSLQENQRMRTYLAGIVEGLPCGVVVFDAGMNLRVINPAATRLLNTDDNNSAASKIPVTQLLGTVLRALSSEDSGREVEWVVTGSECERTLGVTRARLQPGNPGGDSILILRDLTEAKLLEREREISRRSQALAEVATLLAHEVRNPLGSLELFAGLLADALKGQQELQPWVNHIQAGLRSLAATVNNVLQFHSQPMAQLLPVDLKRLLGETLDFLRPLAEQMQLHIEWRGADARLPILADPSRLQQAFFNLALNAFRAMTPGGRLTVCASPVSGKSSPTVSVTFADEGSGISEANLEKIFQPGFTTQSSSPGLGLAVTRKVVEQHGGTVQVESRVGRGTMFTLNLPLAVA